jgi:hypothetical protein
MSWEKKIKTSGKEMYYYGELKSHLQPQIYFANLCPHSDAKMV